MFPVITIEKALGVKLAGSQIMINYIATWMYMLQNHNGAGLPAAIASELARLTTIESEIDISGSLRADFLSRQIDLVRRSLRQQVEFGIAGGGMVFKPCPGEHGISVNYISADACYPVSFDDSGRLTAVVFSEKITRGDNVFCRLEYHHIEPDGCVIENKAYKRSAIASSDTLGEPIPLSCCLEWASLEPSVLIKNIDRLLLGFFKMPLANTIEPGSPLGISAYARAEDLIHEADKQWERILWEYEGTELAIHADEMLFRKNTDGKVLLPQGKDRLYRLINGSGTEVSMLPFSPTIRDIPLFNGFNNILKRIEFACGLAYGTLSDPQNVDKTAEEIKASKQRSFAMVRDIQKALQSALDDLLYAMDVWTTIGKLAPVGKYTVAYSWDDSIINDPSERKKLFWQYVTAGKFPMWRYLAEFEGYGEEDAREIQAEMELSAGDPYALP